MSNMTHQPVRLVTVTTPDDTSTEQKEQPRLRLTRRGRVAIGLFVTLIATTVLALFAFYGAAQAQATSEQDSQQFTYVAAEPGDSMWHIATQVAPSEDPREVIADIVRLNQLSTVELIVGQEVAIPAKYAVTGN